MSISLIANSGIQFYNFDLEIDFNEDVIRPVGFHEYLDEANERISLEYAYYISQLDIWIQKSVLIEQGYLDTNNRVTDGLNPQILKIFALDSNTNYYAISDVETCLEMFASHSNQSIWLPIPYFKTTSDDTYSFGPIAWTRFYIKKINKTKYKIVLAFDTQTSSSNNDNNIFRAPSEEDLNDSEHSYKIVGNEDLLLNFCDSQYSCEWVERHLKRIVQEGSDKEEFPYLKYLSCYIYLIKYLQALKKFPEISLYNGNDIIDVDLVLDIGNSDTCGMLFENRDASTFDFKSVKKLEIVDLSSPDKIYQDPFSMRLVFNEPDFGEINIPGYSNFRWPSLIRVGKEASDLINGRSLNDDMSYEFVCHHSSPKRYLWDDQKVDIPWEFINYNGGNSIKSIYYEGISEQFKEDGKFAFDGEFTCSPTYSRKSLMTFVFIELFLHAFRQINSYEFRNHHGSEKKPRRIRRVTITCPTSIIQKEQIVLRECAEEGMVALKRFYNNSYLKPYDKGKKEEFEIIPSSKDLSKNLTELIYRNDWIYDEATCCQIVYLYSEVSQRYLNNTDVFFNLFGRKRSDNIYKDQKSLTIASIDIGGGTTDLMICNYEYEKGQGLAVLNPNPLFWDSYNLAGDDLLKEMVQHIVIESVGATEQDGYYGIKHFGSIAGVKDLTIKLNYFFGNDTANQSFKHRIFRKNFIIQIGIPIALQYLEHTKKGSDNTILKFADLLKNITINKSIVDYFNEQFSPLKLEETEWTLNSEVVNKIIENTLDPLLRQISVIASAYGADIILLAGRPTTLPKLRELIIKYYPASPDRIISLNNYRVGRWYPGSDDIGYFKEPKTIVCVGAIIALMGGKLDKLGGFRIKTENLKRKLISTSDYVGIMNIATQGLSNLCFSPENNKSEINLHSLPMILGYKQFQNESYRARPIYKIDYNIKFIEEKVREKTSGGKITDNLINFEIENYINNVKNKGSLKVKFNRQWNVSREDIIIELIRDQHNEELPKQLLTIKTMTLLNEKGYWLDSGEFVLNIN